MAVRCTIAHKHMTPKPNLTQGMVVHVCLATAFLKVTYSDPNAEPVLAAHLAEALVTHAAPLPAHVQTAGAF